MSNQKKYLINKLGLGFLFITTTLILNLLALESQAETIFSRSVAREKEAEIATESESESELDFSSSGRSGQQTAGESRGSCPQTKTPLTAIAIKSNANKTIASRPRWWFYLPYKKSEIRKVEFVIQTEQRKDLLREDVTASASSNYFSTTIPNTYSGIEPSHWYRWYLKVYCSGREDTVPLYVSGWVQRVALDSQADDLEQTISVMTSEYIKQHLWLDTVDLLLKARFSQVQTSDWQQLWLKTINSAEIDLELPFPRITNIAIE